MEPQEEVSQRPPRGSEVEIGGRTLFLEIFVLYLFLTHMKIVYIYGVH